MMGENEFNDTPSAPRNDGEHEEGSKQPTVDEGDDGPPASSSRSQDTVMEDATNRKNDLNQDYAVIAKLMKDLSADVQVFANHMNGMVDSVPDYDSLTVLWKGLSAPALKEKHVSAGSNNSINKERVEELILGDEAEDKDDKLIFL